MSPLSQLRDIQAAKYLVFLNYFFVEFKHIQCFQATETLCETKSCIHIDKETKIFKAFKVFEKLEIYQQIAS